MLVIWIALGLILVSLSLWALSRWQQKRIGLPTGAVVFLDTGHLPPLDGTLYSANYQLTGRPDYLINQGGDIIPVEVKSCRAPLAPYDSHLYQLAAYALLIEEHFGRRPHFGILKYRDRSLQIPFTSELMGGVKELMEEMRADASAKAIRRSHAEAARCAACGFRAACDQKLM